MSYSKDLENYPEEFGELIEKASLQGLTLPMPSPADAKRLMGRLYAYKGALKKACHDDPETPDLIRTLYRYSQKCQLRVEGSDLILRPLDRDPDAMLIRAALETNRTDPPPKDDPNTVLVPINKSHLPPWLAELAVQRAEDAKR